MYKNKDKFDGIEIKFIFKQNIFYDKYQFVALFSDFYLESTFIILISQAQTYFYANYDFIILFKNFCQKILLFFKSLK